MKIPGFYEAMSDKEYESIMERSYKAPDYLSPHDMDSRLDDEGYFIDEEFTDYVDLLGQNIFIGVYPLDTIYEGIEGQFIDYINIEDKTNYVDIFYVQLENSINAIKEDENEFHKDELLKKLEEIKDEFHRRIENLFETRLTITISAVDDLLTPDIDEVEVVIRKMYEFFILNARNNFITVIASDISLKNTIPLDDKSFFNQMEIEIQKYSPLLTCITPTKFLQYCEEDDILGLYEDGQVIGNFLRKYSPKLYQNEELKVEIISELTYLNDLKKRIVEEYDQ